MMLETAPIVCFVLCRAEKQTDGDGERKILECLKNENQKTFCWFSYNVIVDHSGSNAVAIFFCIAMLVVETSIYLL